MIDVGLDCSYSRVLKRRNRVTYFTDLAEYNYFYYDIRKQNDLFLDVNTRLDSSSIIKE